ncbi:hypothetical protein ACFQQE_25790 [Glycomyces mayteni]|uniref:hypothetical protein n=1 Tax=Glycomyces mayteni TaxID=543887 RepID=UPI00362126A2
MEEPGGHHLGDAGDGFAALLGLVLVGELPALFAPHVGDAEHVAHVGDEAARVAEGHRLAAGSVRAVAVSRNSSKLPGARSRPLAAKRSPRANMTVPTIARGLGMPYRPPL